MVDIIEQLERLALAVGPINKDDVNRVIHAVNLRLLNLVDAQVVKLYCRKEAQAGIILEPIQFINKMSKYGDPKEFQLPDRPQGVLPWVYSSERPLWLSNIKGRPAQAPLHNLASRDETVNAETLDVDASPDLDAIMVVPVMERGDIHGVYSIEATSSRRFTHGLFELMQEVSRAVAPLLWNHDMYAYDLRKTTRSIDKFLDSISNVALDPNIIQQDVKTAFVARPFEQSFNEVDKILCDLLTRQHKTRGQHYKPSFNQPAVLDDILEQVRVAHFIIADVTSANINVIAEVVDAYAFHKPLLLLRREDDTMQLPFNLPSLPIYRYKVENDQLRVFDPAEDHSENFSVILQRFVDQLPVETRFRVARDYEQ